MKSIKKILFIEFLVIFSFMALLIGVGFLVFNQKKAEGGGAISSVTAMADGGTFIPDTPGGNYSNGWTIAADGLSAHKHFSSYPTTIVSDVPGIKPPWYAETLWCWNDASGNSVYSYILGKPTGVKVSAGSTIYPSWLKKRCVISFDKGGGTGGTDCISVYVNSSFDQTKIAVPQREGYIFLGYKTPDGHGYLYDGNGDLVSNQWTTGVWYYTPTYTIHADWKPKTYNIRFIGNGGKVNSRTEDTHQVSFDESVTIVVDRPGYDFNYFTQEQNPTADSTKYYLSGNQFKVIDFGENGAIVPMYAQWTAKQYSITYDAGGKTLTEGIVPSSVTLNYDDTGGTYQIPSNVLKAKGYEFSGWKNEANKKIYQLGQQVAIKDLFNISTQESVYNISDITLTANWTPITYKIKFAPNTIDIRNEKLFTTPTGSPTIQGLTPSNGTYILTYDKRYDLDYYYECNGYNFLGFRTNAGATGTLYSILDSFYNLTDVKDQEITLYAQWEPTWSKFAHKESAKPVQQGATYLIQSAENLGWLMGTISFGSTELKNSINSTMYTFKQTRNIYLTDYPWNPDGIFSSRYDGNGCYIYDLHTETEENKDIGINECAGLFAETNGASLQKITIMSGNIVGMSNNLDRRSYVGSIVGYASNTLIKNCVNYASVTGNGYVGGIVGGKTDDLSNASATISSCINYGKVAGSNGLFLNLGGIVGYIENGNIKSCYVKATITNNMDENLSGGIAGLATTVTIEQCAFIGNVIQPGSSNGICAWADGASAKDCLVRTSTTGLTLFPDNATNCIGYVNNGTPQTTAEMDYTNWTTVNGQWFPKGLTWLA